MMLPHSKQNKLQGLAVNKKKVLFQSNLMEQHQKMVHDCWYILSMINPACFVVYSPEVFWKYFIKVSFLIMLACITVHDDVQHQRLYIYQACQMWYWCTMLCGEQYITRSVMALLLPIWVKILPPLAIFVCYIFCSSHSCM